MSKVYKIFIDENEIGTTMLEKADASMGVVFGYIDFLNITSVYDFIKSYCLKNGIDFTDNPAVKLISTQNILNLKVFDVNMNEIKGLASSISGIDSDSFEICIEGISYPFYENEFPHHVKQ